MKFLESRATLWLVGFGVPNFNLITLRLLNFELMTIKNMYTPYYPPDCIIIFKWQFIFHLSNDIFPFHEHSPPKLIQLWTSLYGIHNVNHFLSDMASKTIHGDVCFVHFVYRNSFISWIVHLFLLWKVCMQFCLSFYTPRLIQREY